jgi:hypothetical protein
MMSENKYGRCLVDTPGPEPDELMGGANTAADPVPGVRTTHLMSTSADKQDGFFYADGTWLWEGAAAGPVGVPHRHDFDHIIAIAGGHIDDQQDMGGEVTAWLDGNRETVKRNSIIFIPAGVVHGPFLFNKIVRPTFFLTIAMTPRYTRTAVPQAAAPAKEKKYAIVDELYKDFTVAASKKKDAPPPPPPNPNLKGARIMHIEEDRVPGAFYADFVWIFRGTGAAPATEHDHEWPELIAMAGADPAKPRDLGGEMSIVLGGEYHATTKSTLVCIPQKLRHCPWEFHDIKTPTLVFSAGPSHTYTGSHKKDQG